MGDLTICKQCQEEDPIYETCTKTMAKQEFCLTDADLQQIPSHTSRTGWGSKKYLFLKSALIEACYNKFGGAQGLQIKKDSREQFRTKRRLSMELKIKTRKEELDKELEKRGVVIDWTSTLYEKYACGKIVFPMELLAARLEREAKLRHLVPFDVLCEANQELQGLIKKQITFVCGMEAVNLVVQNLFTELMVLAAEDIATDFLDEPYEAKDGETWSPLDLNEFEHMGLEDKLRQYKALVSIPKSIIADAKSKKKKKISKKVKSTPARQKAGKKKKPPKKRKKAQISKKVKVTPARQKAAKKKKPPKKKKRVG